MTIKQGVPFRGCDSKAVSHHLCLTETQREAKDQGSFIVKMEKKDMIRGY